MAASAARIIPRARGDDDLPRARSLGRAARSADEARGNACERRESRLDETLSAPPPRNTSPEAVPFGLRDAASAAAPRRAGYIGSIGSDREFTVCLVTICTRRTSKRASCALRRSRLALAIVQVRCRRARRLNARFERAADHVVPAKVCRSTNAVRGKRGMGFRRARNRIGRTMAAALEGGMKQSGGTGRNVPSAGGRPPSLDPSRAKSIIAYARSADHPHPARQHCRRTRRSRLSQASPQPCAAYTAVTTLQRQ